MASEVCFVLAEESVFHYSPATQMDYPPYIDAVPIQAVAPQQETQDNDFVDQYAKLKKRKSSSKKSTSKQPKKRPGEKSRQEDPNVDNYEVNFDISRVPSPFCSCTGIARGCYRCGTDGWQSKCCTITLSEYPLPISSSKPGSRLSGRKITPGAYKKLLYRLAAQGHDLSHPVDMKNHWAKQGTNKYVKIK